MNISAPTDDSPFFFHMIRLHDVYKAYMWKDGKYTRNLLAVILLGILILNVCWLTAVCIIFPLALTNKNISLKGTFSFFLFFSCIGLGFMFIEISQMQKLIIFLGHPTYRLSVVLFSLLLSSGLGSLASEKLEKNALAYLLIALGVYTIVSPIVIESCVGFSILTRIVLSSILLSFIGFFMGMAFPIGMKLAKEKVNSIAPMLWGVNGATSVCASVIAIAIAITSGINATFYIGLLCYIIAFVSYKYKIQKF